MKPTTQLSEIRDNDLRNRSAGPKTDYAFRTASLAQFGKRCKGTGDEPFRSISGAYFKNEAGRAFALEAALFGLITMISALPIASSVRALIHLVRALGI